MANDGNQDGELSRCPYGTGICRVGYMAWLEHACSTQTSTVASTANRYIVCSSGLGMGIG